LELFEMNWHRHAFDIRKPGYCFCPICSCVPTEFVAKTPKPEPRPPIFPAEWLAPGTVHKAEWPKASLPISKTKEFWALDMLHDAEMAILSRGDSLPSAEIECLKVQVAAEYVPPFTVEEIKRVCPRLYGPVEH
jgi:hypothetical protein